MNNQGKINKLKQLIETHKECIATKERELQELEKEFEYRNECYLTSLTVTNTKEYGENYKLLTLSGKIFYKTNTDFLREQLNATLFMISLANWANEQYPKRAAVHSYIIYDSECNEFLLGEREWNSTITMIKFNNNDAARLAIDTINSTMQFKDFAKTFLGEE